MTRIAFITLATTVCLAAATRADTQRRADATYKWDPRELRWNKAKFDTPPLPVGGYEALVKQLSYPTALRARRVSGSSVASLPIDAAGRIGTISFSPRTAPELEQIVVSAVRRTRFLPARRAGKPVPSVARFPITFVPPR